MKFKMKPFMFKENFLVYSPSLQKNPMIRTVLWEYLVAAGTLILLLGG